MQTQPAKLSDKRNVFGFPKGLRRMARRFGSSFNRIEGDAPNADIDQSHHYNDLVPWFVLIALVAGAALALTIEDRMGRPQELDWAMRTARAEMRAETAQAVAKAQEQAEKAAAVSEIWRNRVNKLEAEVNANRRR